MINLDIDRAKSLLYRDVMDAPDKFRRRWRMSADQAVRYVFDRGKSMGLSGLPCWCWATIWDDEDLEVDIDPGPYGRGLWIQDPRTGRRTDVRFNIVADAIEDRNAWDLLLGDDQWAEYRNTLRFDVLLRTGLVLGQRFLVRIKADWFSDYDGDSDLSWSSEIVYADPPTQAQLDEFFGYLPAWVQAFNDQQDERLRREMANLVTLQRSKTKRMKIGATVAKKGEKGKWL